MVAEPTKLWLQNSKYAKNGAVAHNDIDIRRKLVGVVRLVGEFKNSLCVQCSPFVLRQDSLVLRRPSVAVCVFV